MAEVEGERVEEARAAAELDVEVGADGDRGRDAILKEQKGQRCLPLIGIVEEVREHRAHLGPVGRAQAVLRQRNLRQLGQDV